MIWYVAHELFPIFVPFWHITMNGAHMITSYLDAELWLEKEKSHVPIICRIVFCHN